MEFIHSHDGFEVLPPQEVTLQKSCSKHEMDMAA